MKEMLFITVAILIPPSLTYLGFVGGSAAEPAAAWHAAEASELAGVQRLPGDQPEIGHAAESL